MIVFKGVRTIAKRSAGIVFGMWGAIAVGDVEVRSLFGKCGRCDRFFGIWEGDRFLGFGKAIAFGM